MKINWQKYTFEFLSIFVAVISAFALNNWNENRRDSHAESKILTEIRNGLQQDSFDVKINMYGHEQGINACDFWKRVFMDGAFSKDSVVQNYFELTRDFVSIQNTSGFETLKSKGFELIKNDSLRTKIISLYEYDYQTLRKLEEEYFELQFQENYFHEINQVVAPYLQFNPNGNILGIETPINLSEKDQKLLLSYLWKIKINRRFILQAYQQVEKKIEHLIHEIEVEIVE